MRVFGRGTGMFSGPRTSQGRRQSGTKKGRTKEEKWRFSAANSQVVTMKGSAANPIPSKKKKKSVAQVVAIRVETAIEAVDHYL